MRSQFLCTYLLLLTSTPSSGAPTKRQYGPPAFGILGQSRPGPWSGWTPPWVSQDSDGSPTSTTSTATVTAYQTTTTTTTSASVAVSATLITTSSLVDLQTTTLSSQTTQTSPTSNATSAITTSQSTSSTTASATSTATTGTGASGVIEPTIGTTTASTDVLPPSASTLSSASASSSSVTLNGATNTTSTLISFNPTPATTTFTSTSSVLPPQTTAGSTLTSVSVVSSVTSVPRPSATPYMLNGTLPGNPPPIQPAQPSNGLNVDLVNTFSDSDSVSIYITAMDDAGRVMFLTPYQTWYYPTSTSNTIPQPIDASIITISLGAAGSTTTLNLPGYFNSGRIYFSRTGSLSFFTLLNQQSGVTIVSPNPLNPTDSSYNDDWAFLEMTYTSASGLFANLSFVDFLSLLPLGMQLTLSGGSVQTVSGTSADSVSIMCAQLASEAAQDGYPWDKLCFQGTSGESTSSGYLRANAPSKYIAAVDSSAFRTYWDTYITAVWDKYATEDLLIDTQNGYGIIPCSTASGNLVCPGASRPIPAPLSTSTLFINPALDIFSCSGIFTSLPTDNLLTLAILPRLCAAINRSILLLDNTTPIASVGPSQYYTDPTTNYYAKLVHQQEKDGKGYAFAYDDVSPTGTGDVSGTVAGDPSNGGSWTIWVGGQP